MSLKHFNLNNLGRGKKFRITTVSLERKEAILNKVLSRSNKSISQITREEDIPKSTLYTWVHKLQNEGIEVAEPNNRATKSKLSSEQKFMHVIAAFSLNEESLNANCREHGIYPEDIKSWRQNCIQANAARQEQHKLSKTDSKEDKKRIKALEKGA